MIYRSNPDMIKKVLILLALTIIVPISCSQRTCGIAYRGAKVYDGKVFREDTFYVIDGLISFDEPTYIDSTIHLAGKFIVPPYGEAHNHNMDDYRTLQKSMTYLKQGIFYVKVPNILPRSRQSADSILKTKETVDVCYSNGGITGGGGHPMGVVKRLESLGIYSSQDGEGQFYHTVDDTMTLNSKWPGILLGNPDFIKTYLLFSEEFELRKDDPSYFAQKGLNPELLSAVVRLAHQSGLEVSTHIETAMDFENAVKAGVDEINHFPGFRMDLEAELTKYQLSESSARGAGEKGVRVVTTLGMMLDYLNSDNRKLSAALSVIRHNVNLLKEHRVAIAIGSDNYEGTSYEEALSLSQHGLFTNQELLNMWTKNTARTVFPNRKIGEIKEGCEADFLVLNDNPIDRFENFQDIFFLVKGGEILDMDELMQNATPN